MRPHPKTLAQAVAWTIEGRSRLDVMVDEFLDEFYTEETIEVRQTMIAEEPARTGSERDDAYIGAVGEHLAARWGLAAPDWTLASDREVAVPWFVDGPLGIGLSGLFLVQSPIAFRRRRIFTEAEPLRRARMPRENDRERE